jgi:hypothetical protein
MIRIYLDKNVYSYLKDTNNPLGIQLGQKLQELKPYVVIPYSRAHLSDLSTDYTEEDNQKRIKTSEDLDKIREITEGNCIVSFSGKKQLQPTIADPRVFFQDVVSDRKTKTIDYILSLETLFDEDGSLQPLNILWKKYINLLKILPLGIDFASMESTPEGQSFLSMFPRARYSNTLWDMMCDFAELIDSMDTQPERYIQLRNLVRNGLQVGSHISNFNIQQLDKYFLGTALKKTFTDFVQDTVKASKKDENDITYEDRFMTTFSNLDMIGYRPDKFDKGYTNFFNDIQHSFYAAHCDYFVTNDTRTLEKARLIYSKESISTKALTPKEFLEELETLSFKKSPIELSNDIAEIIDTGLRGAVSDIETRQEIYFYYCNPCFLNYFNYMEAFHYPDGKVVYLFSKKPENYSNMVFYKEIENLVNLLVEIFGSDHNSMAEFDRNIEHELINKKTWEGRKWLFNGLSIILCRLDDELYPSLYISKQQTTPIE